MMFNKMEKYIEIREFGTDEVVKSFDVTGKTKRIIDKLDYGLNINLNQEDFYTIIKETKGKNDK